MISFKEYITEARGSLTPSVLLLGFAGKHDENIEYSKNGKVKAVYMNRQDIIRRLNESKTDDGEWIMDCDICKLLNSRQELYKFESYIKDEYSYKEKTFYNILKVQRMDDGEYEGYFRLEIIK